MTIRVFYNEKQKLKEVFEEEAKNFLDMIDCVDETPALDYTVMKHGVKIRIVAEII